MLAELLATELTGVFLVLARIGSALMVVPVFGEHYVLARQRLLLALLLSVLLAPLLADRLPPLPGEPMDLALLVLREVATGLFIGAVTRLALALLQVGGTLIAMQSGLSSAAMFDPTEATQGNLPGNFLTMTAVVLMVALNLHHLLLRGLVASYTALPPGVPLPLDDMTALLTRLGGAGIATGLQVAAPVVVVSLLANLALGVIGRIMPAFQALSVALPLQLLLAMGMMLVLLAGALHEFARFFAGSLSFLAAGG